MADENEPAIATCNKQVAAQTEYKDFMSQHLGNKVNVGADGGACSANLSGEITKGAVGSTSCNIATDLAKCIKALPPKP